MLIGMGVAGRDGEFVAFVRDAQLRLRRVAFLVCGDWHRAEDIVQAALVKLYRNWARVDRGGDPWPYARRAVVNAAIDDSRRPWRRESAAAVLPDVPLAEAPPTDDLVVAALAALPAKQRAVVVLRCVEDLDVEAVATLLNMPTGTVKSHAARGLAALRERLDGAHGSARAVSREPMRSTR